MPVLVIPWPNKPVMSYPTRPRTDPLRVLLRITSAASGYYINSGCYHDTAQDDPYPPPIRPGAGPPRSRTFSPLPPPRDRKAGRFDSVPHYRSIGRSHVRFHSLSRRSDVKTAFCRASDRSTESNGKGGRRAEYVECFLARLQTGSFGTYSLTPSTNKCTFF